MNRRGPPSMPHAGLAIAGLRSSGRRLVKIGRVQAAIDAGVETAGTTSSEVLARIADVATSDILDFMKIGRDGQGRVDLRRVKRLGLGHLIKRLRINKDGSQHIELEPRMPALVKLGDYHKLWKGEGQPQLTLFDLAKDLRAEYERIEREERRGRQEMTQLLKLCHDRPGAVQ